MRIDIVVIAERFAHAIEQQFFCLLRIIACAFIGRILKVNVLPSG